MKVSTTSKHFEALLKPQNSYTQDSFEREEAVHCVFVGRHAHQSHINAQLLLEKKYSSKTMIIFCIYW